MPLNKTKLLLTFRGIIFLLFVRQNISESVTQEGDYTLEEAAEGFLEFWEDHAELHFREEEDVILPVFSRLGSITEDENIRKMLDDHAWFRG